MDSRDGGLTGPEARATAATAGSPAAILAAALTMVIACLWPADTLADICDDLGPPPAPAALSPAGQQGYLPVLPTYEWTCVEPAISYVLRVEDGRGIVYGARLFGAPLGCSGGGQCVTPTCSWTPGPFDYYFNLAPGATTWTVQGNCAGTVSTPDDGEISQPQTFFIQSDQEPVSGLIAPLSITRFSNPIFYWEPSLDATSYTLLVKAPGSSVIYFEDTVVPAAVGCSDGLTTCGLDAELDLALGTTFIWTVQSFGPSGYGPLSEIEEVTVVDPIFDDDFESQDTSEWSSTEPPS